MRLNELDLLRFMAAISVVLFHYIARYTVDIPLESTTLNTLGHLTQFGFLGVHLFFMISGYVILASADNRSKIEFLIVRCVRLFPVYWLSVTLTTVMLVLLAPNNGVSLFDYFVNLTMLQSFVGVSNIDGIYWTLAKELQFYGCIFILISCNLLHRINYWLPIWLLLTLAYAVFGQPFFMGWFISPEYSPFFIAGVYFYLLRKNGNQKTYYLGLITSLILAMYHTYKLSPTFLNTFTSTEQTISCVIIFCFYLIFWLAVKDKWNISQKKTYVVLGALTYPLYLVHNIIGKMIIDYLHPYMTIELAVLVVTILMLFLSYFIYSCYEINVSTKIKNSLLNRLNKS